MNILIEQYEKALKYISRDNISALDNWLRTETDFFTAPASTVYHSNFEGGLLIHTLNVLHFALHNFNLIVKYKPEYEYLRESVVICALFHDISKTNFYKITEKWTKDENNKWKSYQGYEVIDLSLPLPHGPKSVYLLSKFIKLTDSEATAISWHMGATDIVQPESVSKYAYENAYKHPLTKIIIAADTLAITIEDVIDYKKLVK